MSRKTLHQLYAEHQGKVSDKWSLYLTEYDHLFDGYRDKPVRLLEIGIQNGGSLDIWSKYFSNASVLIGCDINPDCARLIYDDQRIGVIVGDANAPEVHEQVFQRSPQFDIIIDDGSHLSSEIIKSFALYFPLISEGGAFIAEDLHCSYWGQYEGGLFDPYSSIAFFKRLADVINHEHWGVAKTRADVLRGIFTKYDCEIDVEALSQVHSVEFINSMCVVRKAPVADNRLGRRIIAGSMELVVPGLHALNNRPYQLEAGLDQSSNPWTARATPPDEAIQHTEVALANAQQQIAGLSQAVTERDGQITSLSQAVTERDGQIASLSQTVTERDGQIAHLDQALGERDRQIGSLDQKCAEAERSFEEIRASKSWLITAPMRFASTKAKNIINLIKLLPRVYHFGGGPVGVARKAWRVFAREGWVGVKRRIVFVAQGRSVSFGSEPEKNEQNDYSEWVRRYDTLTDADREKIRTRIDGFHRKPLFSVVMPVYNPPIVFFEKAIQSVRNQLYPDWELCIADDASTDPLVRKVIERHCKQDRRIKVVYRTENGHISKASNSALELAQGDYVAMFDHDDAIPEHALYLFAEELNRNPETDFLYSDQDKIDTNDVRYDPYFKPDFNPDLLRSQNFVDHLAVFRTSIVRELGGWRTEFDGSQDYDLVLRVTERISPSRIRHIPYVLYHWRAVPGSLAIDSGAKNYAPVTSRKALAEHLERLGVQGEVTSQYPDLSIHRVVYPLLTEPMVSVIIPTKDGVDILSQCIDGLLNKTEYKNVEIIIVNNQSSEPDTHSYFEKICADPRIKVIDFDEPFNYSRINNIAAREAKGSVLALLNNDIEIINRDWLREMVSHAVRPEIGAVGARLYYPDGTVQHAGVLLGYKGRAGHMYRYASPDWLGYWARGVLIQNLTAVTAACMVLRKDLFEAIGGFDEENFTVTFNDVDLCLRIYEKGYRNLYTPYAELYHHESKTRGLLAFQSEEDYFALRWKKYIEHDPAYNPNLSLMSENFALAYPPRVSRPWIEQGENPDRSGAPLVTVITRTHGGRHEFLRESLASVFRQTYRPIQIVIVEDGGNNMRAMIDTISPPKGITIDYESLPKRGRCYAGNRGLELARGELFCFLDDDDLFLPDHVESLVQCLNSHPIAVGAYASSWEVPTEVISLSPLKYREGRKRLFGNSNWSLSQLWDYNYIPIQSLLLRKELYIKYGGLSEELDCLEDWDLWLRYTAEGDFVFLNKPTSEFRMPKNEAVLLDRQKQHLQYLPILRKRQMELLDRYKNRTSHERLRAAFSGK